jgi:bifunctional non-homologous end joining protein LigD
LALFVDREVGVNAVLDGEVVCFDAEGKPRFYELMFGRRDPAFVAFNVLALKGRALRERTLVERKKILRRLIPRRSPFVSFRGLHRNPCLRLPSGCLRRRPRGIVAKWKAAPYRPDAPLSSWLKAKNPDYSQARDRGELFER